MLQAKPAEPALEKSQPESTPATRLLGRVSCSSTPSALFPIFVPAWTRGNDSEQSLISQLGNADDQGTAHVLSDLPHTLQTQLKSLDKQNQVQFKDILYIQLFSKDTAIQQ